MARNLEILGEATRQLPEDFIVRFPKVKSDKPPKPGGFVRYDTKITLRGDANHLVVALYDPLSGKIATAESDISRP